MIKRKQKYEGIPATYNQVSKKYLKKQNATISEEAEFPVKCSFLN
jgi:hypothetical protein